MNRVFLGSDFLRRGSRVIAPLVLVGVLLPLALTNFQCFMAAQVMVYAIAILGLNLLTGFNGQISLGHGAFFAAGAYTAAILMDRGVPFWATLPVAGLLCLLAGFLFGLPALRLRGHYLAMATFALALAVPQLLKYKFFEVWTGGAQGLAIGKPASPFQGVLLTRKWSDDVWLYYVVFFVMVLLFLLARNLVEGRVGRSLIAIRDHQLAAEAMGVNSAITKSTVFGISAMYTAIAGALSACITPFVAPDSFTVALSIALLVGLVVGGIGAIPGALLGGAFIVFVPNVANDISKAATGAIYGLFLIVMMYLLPGGVWPWLAGCTRRLVLRGRSSSSSPP